MCIITWFLPILVLVLGIHQQNLSLCFIICISMGVVYNTCIIATSTKNKYILKSTIEWPPTPPSHYLVFWTNRRVIGCSPLYSAWLTLQQVCSLLVHNRSSCVPALKGRLWPYTLIPEPALSWTNVPAITFPDVITIRSIPFISLL